MSSVDKSNELATRKLCKNICNILGLSSLMTKHFMIIVKEALVHNIAEVALNFVDGKIQATEMNIPFIGCLLIQFDGDHISDVTITLESEFAKQIEYARNEGKSPLLEHAEQSMVAQIKKQYDAII